MYKLITIEPGMRGDYPGVEESLNAAEREGYRVVELFSTSYNGTTSQVVALMHKDD